MNTKLRWGVLGTANIAVKKVIPAMKSCSLLSVDGIASRSIGKAQHIAADLGIKKYYGSYDDLISDEEIDAIYNPLPNHLHLEWSKKAAERGKHVLCEKPIGMNADEVRRLIEIRNQTGVRIQEAFMVRTHPTWVKVREIIKSGRIGNVDCVTGFFSYFNVDSGNIRNKLEMGGGALMDIGCYCINFSRFVFEDEPKRVSSLVTRDRAMGIDKLTTAILDFSGMHASFTCSTQLVPHQKIQVFGSKGRIEMQIPFNIPTDQTTRMFIDDGSDLYGKNVEVIEFEPSNQYTIQGELFSKAILEGSEQPVSLEDSYRNMSVIDAVFRSAETGKWEVPNIL